MLLMQGPIEPSILCYQSTPLSFGKDRGGVEVTCES